MEQNRLRALEAALDLLEESAANPTAGNVSVPITGRSRGKRDDLGKPASENPCNLSEEELRSLIAQELFMRRVRQVIESFEKSPNPLEFTVAVQVAAIKYPVAYRRYLAADRFRNPR